MKTRQTNLHSSCTHVACRRSVRSCTGAACPGRLLGHERLHGVGLGRKRGGLFRQTRTQGRSRLYWRDGTACSNPCLPERSLSASVEVHRLFNANMQRRSIVGIAGTLNRMIMKIMAAPQIKTPADLRGKRIAVTRFGTSTDFAARLFLRNSGLSPRKGRGDSASRERAQCLGGPEERYEPSRSPVAAGPFAGRQDGLC